MGYLDFLLQRRPTVCYQPMIASGPERRIHTGLDGLGVQFMNYAGQGLVREWAFRSLRPNWSRGLSTPMAWLSQAENFAGHEAPHRAKSRMRA